MTRLYMYSLKEDLYCRRPLKGDLHLHTVFSDGNENPEVVVSNMRRFGNDFCALRSLFMSMLLSSCTILCRDKKIIT